MIFNEISFRVRYGETDQMGYVHHGNYAQYLEMGRIEWLRSMGVSYKSMEDNGVMLPVISMQINFKKSAFYDDLITIKTTIKEKPAVRISFAYELYNQKNELLAKAETTLVFVNMKTTRPMKCPEYILEKMGF
ncbi:MAG: thioesterase family protein [Cellulophaga sp.]